MVPHRLVAPSLIACVVALGPVACNQDEPGTSGGSTETSATGAETETSGETGTPDLGGETPIPEDAVWLELGLDAPIAEVDPRFLSYTLDTSKVVSNPFDFERPRLIALASELSPALLRIGGTNADAVYYDMSDAPLDEAPEGYDDVMTKALWDQACSFAAALDVEMMFTINAGLGPRDIDEVWTDAQARELIEYSVANDCPVEAWEFGNEIGLFGSNFGFSLSGEQYAADFTTFAAMLDEVDPGALATGPAAAYWPIEGEVPIKHMPAILAGAGDLLDVVTWHYYPMQSASCPIGSRPTLEKMPIDWLETIDSWAEELEGQRDADAPGAQIWLAETGHAQCGGEPGISETLASSFWWLDQLGRVARRGQPLVARQALVATGSYRLIEDSELAPTPDYYASVLWNRHMGTRVLDAQVIEGPESLLTYAHCDPATPGGVSIVAINYDEQATRSLVVVDGETAFESVVVTGADDPLLATELLVNGETWVADEAGHVPPTPAEAGVGVLELPPLSYAFVRPALDAPACG